MSKKMFSRERERGKLRFSALLILIGLLLFGCDPTMVTITYNANGGKGEMKPQAVESGVEVKLIANTFTKDGSDFTGWNEAADGSGKAYADGAAVTLTGNLTLYAQWQEKPAEEPEQPGEVTDPDEPGGEVTDPDEPGGEVTDPEQPGGEVTDPDQPEDPPVSLENHITNTAFIAAVEAVYPSIGWTKTEDGYVDMTVEANQTAVTGVESLDLSGQGLTSSEGLEYFTGLKQLTLSATKDGSDKQNALTELDVSALTALTSLVLDGNPLTALPDLTNQSALVSLNAASCGLTAVSGLPASLMILNLSDNELTALDVSALTNLASLLCYRNQMNALDITTLSSLNELYCGAQKTEGDLSLNATSEQLESLRNLFEGNVEDNAFLLLNSDVVWIVPAKDFDLTAGTAVFNKTTGLTLSFGENQTLPEGAVASVSLGENEAASENVSVGETAITVALAALANDTVDMTVTVTVSAAGYNDAELTYSGVNTVWMPENVTAALADNEAKIGGESVSVTISQTEGSDDLSGIKISSGTYSVGQNAAETLAIGSDGRSFTAPILPPDAEDTGTAVTVSLVLAKANATDTVPVDGLTLTVYPSTHVRFDGKFYALAQGFDFTDENTLSDVKDGENAIDSVSEEGYVFSISPTVNEKKSLNFSLIDSDNIVLTMIEAKWDRNNCANIFVVGVDGQGRAAYGWSPFKGNYSFMLGEAASGADSGQRWNSKNDYVRLSVNPTENTFNKYFVFDDGGESNATLGFNDEVKLTTAAITSQDDITRISSISSDGAWPLTFQHANGDDTTNPVTYTLRAVNFYKAISQ